MARGEVEVARIVNRPEIPDEAVGVRLTDNEKSARGPGGDRRRRRAEKSPA